MVQMYYTRHKEPLKMLQSKISSNQNLHNKIYLKKQFLT